MSQSADKLAKLASIETNPLASETNRPLDLYHTNREGSEASLADVSLMQGLNSSNSKLNSPAKGKSKALDSFVDTISIRR